MSSVSLIHTLNKHQYHFNESLQSANLQRARSILANNFLTESSQWTVYKCDTPFKRRVTCVEWHPTYTNVVAVGSKAGDVLLWKYNESTEDSRNMIEGIGYGYGLIAAMKFHPKNLSCMYTTSIDGTFRLQDFTRKHSYIYLDTQDYKLWWVAFDYCLEYDVLFVGDNTGKAVLLSTEGTVIKEFKKFHKGKIKHAEFCPAQSHILATSSVDHTVQLWDLRMLKEEGTTSVRPLSSLPHSAAVSSAHFDPLSGTRLLTTSQDGQLRVYDSYNLWSSPTTTIEHAHRHFQHLTDVTATWHPLFDNICVVGRYPKPAVEDPIRGVDLINLTSGKKEGHIHSAHVSGILSVNKFNQTGDTLVSGEGCRIIVWKVPSNLQDLKRQSTSGSVPGLVADTQKRRKKISAKKNDDAVIKKLKRKVACEVVSNTKRRKR